MHLYNRGVVAGAVQHLLALVINLWDALDSKREMPIILAAPEVHYRDSEGQVWDSAVRIPPWFDLAACEFGARPAIAGSWPWVRLLWPDSAGGSPPSCLRDSGCPPTGVGPSGYSGIWTGRPQDPWPREVPGA